MVLPPAAEAAAEEARKKREAAAPAPAAKGGRGAQAAKGGRGAQAAKGGRGAQVKRAPAKPKPTWNPVVASDGDPSLTHIPLEVGMSVKAVYNAPPKPCPPHWKKWAGKSYLGVIKSISPNAVPPVVSVLFVEDNIVEDDVLYSSLQARFVRPTSAPTAAPAEAPAQTPIPDAPVGAAAQSAVAEANPAAAVGEPATAADSSDDEIDRIAANRRQREGAARVEQPP